MPTAATFRSEFDGCDDEQLSRLWIMRESLVAEAQEALTATMQVRGLVKIQSVQPNKVDRRPESEGAREPVSQWDESMSERAKRFLLSGSQRLRQLLS